MSKSRFTKTVIACFLLAATLTHAGAESRLVTHLNDGTQQTVVTYGTSLTARPGWVNQLREVLNTRYPGQANVINSGQGAKWSTWGVDHLDGRVIEKKPDTVFIEFAINDADLRRKTSVHQAQDNLENMIERILKDNPECEIILMTMNPPVGKHLKQRPRIKEYYQMYRDVAKARDFLLIDHYPEWAKILENDPDLFKKYVPDDIHPTREGCKAVTTPNIIKALGIEAEQKNVPDTSEEGAPFPGSIDRADKAYGLVVQKVMPPYLTGFFAAVLLGAILSSFNSALNSTCTMFSLGVYKGMLRRDAGEEAVIKSGKSFGWIIAIAAMCIAPMLLKAQGIFSYLQTMNAIYFVPILAVVVVGLLTRRVPAIAANVGMVFAFAVIIAVYFIPGLKDITNAESPRFLLHNFHFIALVLIAAVALMLVIGKAKPLDTPWEHTYTGDVDMKPWKYAVPVAAVLVAIVATIYGVFADFSALKGVEPFEVVVAVGFTACVLFALMRFRNGRDLAPDIEDPEEGNQVPDGA